MKKTLIFFIDAIRKDCITKETTPFLYELMRQHTYLDVISLLGYSSGIHPSIFNAVYQEKHGHFLVYSFDPKNSPFKWMRTLSIVPTKIRQYLLSILKAPYYMLNIKSLFPKWYMRRILPIPASIDPKVAGFFKVESEVFDNHFVKLLKNNKITFSSQPDIDSLKFGKGVGIENWKLTDYNIDYYFVSETDPVLHYHGVNSNEMRKKMNLIDKKIKALLSDAENKYGKVNIFVFSDHGMVDLKSTINVKKVLEKSGLKDFIVFYDSTMVRFWTEDKKTQEKIISLLSRVPHLTYLDDRLKEKYRIRFKTRKWGDLFFIADPGYRIFPDYFAPVRFNTRGMHGYWPEYKQSKGIFISNAFKTNKKEIGVVDIIPTILKITGLKPLGGADGKSII